MHCGYPNCKKKYTSRFTLKRHLEAYHYRVGRFPCSLCRKSFAYRHTLRAHLRKHESPAAALPSAPKLTTLLYFTKDPELLPWQTKA